MLELFEVTKLGPRNMATGSPEWPEGIALSWWRSLAKAALVRSIRWKSLVKVSCQRMSAGDLEVNIYWASQGVMMLEGFHYQWQMFLDVSSVFPPPGVGAGRFWLPFFLSMYTAASNGFIPMFYTMLVVYFHILDYLRCSNAVYDIWIYMMYDILDTWYYVISFFVRKSNCTVYQNPRDVWPESDGWRERERYRDLKIYIT